VLGNGARFLWLAGVRRVGKTYLSQSLPDIEYFDCELPRIRRMLEDPQPFLEMILAYRQRGQEIPPGNALIEPLPVEIADVRQTA
jgi:predicted AAA+ superfamily ATPase